MAMNGWDDDIEDAFGGDTPEEEEAAARRVADDDAAQWWEMQRQEAATDAATDWSPEQGRAGDGGGDDGDVIYDEIPF